MYLDFCTVNVRCQECNRIDQVQCKYGVIHTSNEEDNVLEGVCADCLWRITMAHTEDTRYETVDAPLIIQFRSLAEESRYEPERPA